MLTSNQIVSLIEIWAVNRNMGRFIELHMLLVDTTCKAGYTRQNIYSILFVDLFLYYVIDYDVLRFFNQ